MQRKCDNCKKEYTADERNIKRGWGLCCSKSCAAKVREKSKPSYNAKTVAVNNVKRRNWNNRPDPRIGRGLAYDELSDYMHPHDSDNF